MNHSVYSRLHLPCQAISNLNIQGVTLSSCSILINQAAPFERVIFIVITTHKNIYIFLISTKYSTCQEGKKYAIL
jgi:hypothetical protein